MSQQEAVQLLKDGIDMVTDSDITLKLAVLSCACYLVKVIMEFLHLNFGLYDIVWYYFLARVLFLMAILVVLAHSSQSHNLRVEALV